MTVMENSKILKNQILKVVDNIGLAVNKKIKLSNPMQHQAFFNETFSGLLIKHSRIARKPDFSSARYINDRINRFTKLCICVGAVKRTRWLTNPAVVFYPWKHIATFARVLRFKKGRKYVLGRTSVFTNTKLLSVKILNSRDSSGITALGSFLKKKIKFIRKSRHVLYRYYEAKILGNKKRLLTAAGFVKTQNVNSLLPAFSAITISNTRFYTAPLISKSGLDDDEISSLYKNTLHASLYNEYRDYAVTSVIKKLSCFFRLQSSAETSLRSVYKNANYSSKRKTMKQFVYARNSIYLKTYGPVAKIARRRRFLTIRFVPGYLPFFRKIRARFLRTRRLEIGRQRMLTRYLVRYRRLSNSAMLKHYSMALRQVIVCLKFAYNMDNASEVISSGNIFVNGVAALDPFFQLYKYDFVGFRVDYFNYSLIAKNILKTTEEIFKFYTNINKIEDLRKRRLSHKINSYNRYLYRKYEKVRLSRVERVYSSITDVPEYFEIDYLTLTAVILFEPDRVQDHDQIFVRCSAFSFIKMLNWKYMC